MFQNKLFIQRVDAKQDNSRKQEEVHQKDKAVGEGILDEGVKEVNKKTEVKARDSRD